MMEYHEDLTEAFIQYLPDDYGPHTFERIDDNMELIRDGVTKAIVGVRLYVLLSVDLHPRVE